MNEILGPIYYSFAADPDPECKGMLQLNAKYYWMVKNIVDSSKKNLTHLLFMSHMKKIHVAFISKPELRTVYSGF